jgi:tetratricopeptide (TPR) repeat protein
LRQARAAPGLAAAAVLAAALLGALSAGALPAWAAEGSEAEQFGLARALLAEGDYFRAITEFKRFLFFFPESERADEARVAIGDALLAAGRPAEAEAAFGELRRLKPASPEAERALFGQALAQLAMGRRSQGRQSLRELLGGRYRSRAQLELALSLAEEGEWTRAREELAALSEPGSLLERRLAVLREAEAQAKSPALAGALSALLPGAGQLYCGRVRDAGLALLVNGLFIWATVEAGLRENWPLTAGLGLIEVAWYGGTIYGAVSCVYKRQQALAAQAREQLERLPEAGGGVILAWGYRF